MSGGSVCYLKLAVKVIRGSLCCLESRRLSCEVVFHFFSKIAVASSRLVELPFPL